MENKRDVFYIDDDLFCLKEMATNPDVNSQIINIGPDEEFISINNLAEKIVINLNLILILDMYQEDLKK